MHTRLFITAAALSGAMIATACSNDDNKPAPDAQLDRSKLSNVGTDATPLDYSDPALWLCRPDGGNLNECARNIDATEIQANGTLVATPHTAAASPAFDCFYVYPTVTFGQANDTDFTSVTDQLDALLGQAARFSRVCNVYAPLYRQVGLGADGKVVAGANPALGLADARAAFAYYLANLNKGRPFVLIGHSQGTAVLTALIRLDVDAPGKDAVLAKLISAVLIGGNVRVAKDPAAQVTCTPGATDCQSFATLKPCTSSTDTHCFIAYSSYRVAAPPPANALFGAQTEHTKVACTNPSELNGNTGAYKGTYIPVKVNNPTFAPGEGEAALSASITTPFVVERDKFKGACVENDFNSVTYNYLEITPLPKAGADTRPIPPYANAASELLGFGEHIFDFAFTTDDLIELVQKQAAALH